MKIQIRLKRWLAAGAAGVVVCGCAIAGVLMPHPMVVEYKKTVSEAGIDSSRVTISAYEGKAVRVIGRVGSAAELAKLGKALEAKYGKSDANKATSYIVEAIVVEIADSGASADFDGAGKLSRLC